MDYDKLLNLATELGYQLMSSGAEIYRVEESIFRLLRAYGLDDPQVFAIPNTLIVSVTTPDGHPITRLRRIPSHGTDIELLEKCNDLCRSLCFRPVSLDQAQERVALLGAGKRSYPVWLRLVGNGLAAGCFSCLFGGSVQDALCAFLCGMVIGMLGIYGRWLLGSNNFFRTAMSSATASLLALLLVRLGLGQDADAVTIGVLMLLVPGAALTNAMREIMAGDITSGINRIAEALLLGAAIALGTVVGLGFGRIL